MFQKGLSRRTFVRQTLPVAGGLFFPSLSPALPRDLDIYDPFGKVENYEKLRRVMNRVSQIEQLIKDLWRSYETTGNARHGIWTLYYTALLWQVSPDPKQRTMVAKAGIQLARRLQKRFPKKLDPFFWESAFLAFHALTQGVLNSLQFIPIYESRLRTVEKRNPKFFYGGVYLLLAKLYMKTPPFPVSVGDLGKAKENLEKARPYQEKIYALWYIALAEYYHIVGETEKVNPTLERIHKEVCPIDAMTYYTYELAMHQAEAFREAIKTGKYDRYMWDPFLEPAIALTRKRYTPKRICG